MEYYNFIAYTSVVVLLISLIGVKLESLSISAPLIALLAGLVAGPYVFDLFNLTINTSALKLIAEITIAIAVMSGALKVPKNYLTNNMKPIAVLLFIIMPGMWLLSSVGIYWFLPGITWGMALLLGAILSPTDPVVSSTIITGKFAEKYFPNKLRNLTSFESGANDGLAYPIVFLSLFLLRNNGTSLSEWFIKTVLYQNIIAILIGLICGYVLGKLYHYANKKSLMPKSAYVIYTFMITISLLFACKYLEMNGIISVFVAGLLFNISTDRNEEKHMYEMQETFENLFTIPVFLILGYILPVSSFLALGFPLISCIMFLLLFRRIPIIHALLVCQKLRNEKELLLLGWFGPIGIAALYYSLEIKEITGESLFFEVTSFSILVSTLVHGLTSLPLSKWYKNSVENSSSISQQKVE